MTQFSAKIIKDSINHTDTRITTFELEYPRFLHSEILTHRLFSRNSASSRAIPVGKIIEQVHKNPARPIHWGKSQAGMQAREELTGDDLEDAKFLWDESSDDAVIWAEAMLATGGHKQWVNRVLEPYQIMKTVLTSTDFENFFWLRNHEDAQPEIQHLAKLMLGAYENSNPTFLQVNHWHLPYVKCKLSTHDKVQEFYDEYGNLLTLDQAIRISCSSCAQVSYRKLDTSLEKADVIYNKLINSKPVHASAFEHVAKCVLTDIIPSPRSAEGWTHSDFEGNLYSGNFRNWVQYRQLINGQSRAYSSE